jgi:hypothetical protein
MAFVAAAFAALEATAFDTHNNPTDPASDTPATIPSAPRQTSPNIATTGEQIEHESGLHERGMLADACQLGGDIVSSSRLAVKNHGHDPDDDVGEKSDPGNPSDRGSSHCASVLG